jgi:hypothetical protein
MLLISSHQKLQLSLSFYLTSRPQISVSSRSEQGIMGSHCSSAEKREEINEKKKRSWVNSEAQGNLNKSRTQVTQQSVTKI